MTDRHLLDYLRNGDERVQRGGRQRATELPALPPQWARDVPRLWPAPRQQQQEMIIGPGGVLDAPPPMPLPPPPTRYSSMREAQLADAMMMQPLTPLPSSLEPMPPQAGFASGTQPNGMRVPPAPASFGERQPVHPAGFSTFGKRDGLTDEEAWSRALQRARTRTGKTPLNLRDQLFSAVIGPPRRSR